jgi:hypothetical protein
MQKAFEDGLLRLIESTYHLSVHMGMFAMCWLAGFTIHFVQEICIACPKFAKRFESLN